MRLLPGEQPQTTSGRFCTPFPKANCGTERKAVNAVKKIGEWLRDNAIQEARSRGDDHNLRIIDGIRSGKASQADRDFMHMYLFGVVR
jgi:hypothetical protein